MRTPTIVLSIAALAFGAFALVGLPEPEHDVQPDGRRVEESCTNDTTPVDLVVPARGPGKALALRIPANYLSYDETFVGGKQRRVRINASYPSLDAWPIGTVSTPCTLDSVRERSTEDSSHWAPDRLEIQLGFGADGFEERPDAYLRGLPDLAGFRHLESECMLEPDFNPMTAPSCEQIHGYLPLDPQKNPGESIECLGFVDLGWDCHGFIEFRGQPVRVAFKRSRLSEWGGISKATRDFLEKFAAKE